MDGKSVETNNSMTEEICSTYYQSPVGLLRISGRANYISGIHFIDHLEDQDKTQPPQEPAPILIQCVEQLIEYFQGARRQFEFPVHQDGTSFQQSVWNELIGIPFGKTISYLELSRKLGDPKVIRAAATANGKNNVSIVIPCHRVIGSKNELVGYGGGLWRKKWLLMHEAKIAHGVQTLFEM
ncbi:MAG TPA: methylated-DNA--[protein]-cysteine S-methyltransferase [Puia sp.]|nr:methylated-DNA--[protein]-cysteine S-methyltransferase [Puia sp.]